MPGTLRFYDPDDERLREQADAERIERIKQIDSWWRWREGEHPDVLKTYPGERDDNVKLNLVGQIVDATTEFIGVPSLVVSGDKAFSSGLTEDMQAAIDAVLDMSDFGTLAGDVAESALVTGHVFLRVLPPDEGPIDASNPPTLALIDPRHVTVFWDVESFGRRKLSRLWHQLTWEAGDKQKRQDIVPARLVRDDFPVAEVVEAARGAEYVIIEYEKTRHGEWAFTGVDGWEWPFSPIVDMKASRKPHAYYGRSMVAGLWRLNDYVNFTTSNIGKILRYHAHPKTVLINATLDTPSTGADELIEIRGVGDTPPEVYNVEMQSDLGSSLAYQARMRAAMFAAARVVDPLTVHDKVGQLTNFGLRTLYKNMLDMTASYREQLGTVFAEAVWRALWMWFDEDLTLPLAVWDEPLPMNRNEVLQAAQMEKNLGTVSNETLAGDLGRDWQSEQQRLNDEAVQAGESVTRQLELFGERGLMT